MKKYISIILALTMLLSICTGCGKKNETTKTESDTEVTYEYVYREMPEPTYIEAAATFAGGTGTESDPYQISNASELALMEQKINDDETLSEYKNAYYVLTADISLNDTADFANWATTAPTYSWRPMSDIGLRCVLDGNGHTIRGMYININCEESYDEYGLFGRMNGTIKNLTIEESYICVSGKMAKVGTFAGEVLTESVIQNCTSTATIECYDGTYGGIVGGASGDSVEKEFSKVTSCVFKGTINQIREGSMNNLGGIAGSSGGEITGCVNEGTINFGGEDVDTVGGIVARGGSGKIEDCENKGTLNCTVEGESVGARVGGIMGLLFISSTGTKNMSRGITVQNCRNTGTVTGQMYAGGIIGAMNQDRNDYCATVSGCENSGMVSSMNYTAGIIGNLECTGHNDNGNNVVIENCKNTANLSVENSDVAGIIGHFTSNTGDVVIKGCVNTGELTTTEQNCAGIIAHWMVDSEPDTRVTIEGCENQGTLTSSLNVGGILGFADVPVLLKNIAGTKISVTDCKNSGMLVANGQNGYMGGIAANIGMRTIPTTISNCENTGSINLNNPSPSEEEVNTTYKEGETTTFTISRICGGIVGRVGSGLLLTTDSDEVKTENVNKKNAFIQIIGCNSTGTLTVADDEEYVNPQGVQLYENFFGGVVGNVSAEDDYSIWVEDCSYINFERGLGNKDLPDVGEKK